MFLLGDSEKITAVDNRKIPNAALKENALEISPSGATAPPNSITHIQHIPASKNPNIPVITNHLFPTKNLVAAFK